MADEPIGSVSVNITGDYSDLEQSLNAAQGIAQSAGQNMAEAFVAATTGTQEFDSSLKNLTDSGMTSAQAMAQLWRESITGSGAFSVAAAEATKKTEDLG